MSKTIERPESRDRGQVEPGLLCRAISIAQADGGPKSINVDERSVEVVCASETPVMERDWDTWELMPTVLLMSGCELPENNQVPLLNSHDRLSAQSVIGSVRNLRIEAGQLIGRAYFSRASEVETIWQRVQEGHITDLSIGRTDSVKPIIIPAGNTGEVGGRFFTGPCRVVTRWRPKETSVTPIGADATAKMRSLPHHSEGNDMDGKELEKTGGAAGATLGQHEVVERSEAAQPAAVPQVAAPAQVAAAHAAPAVASERGLSFADGLLAVNRCARLGIVGQEQENLLRSVVSQEQLDRALLQALEKRSAAAMPGAAVMPASGATVVADERDKLRRAITDALLLRSGVFYRKLALDKGGEVEKRELERKPAPGHEDFANYGLQEIARRCLVAANQPQGGDIMGMVGRAFLSSDLKNILDTVSNKIFEAGFDTVPSEWRQWASVGSVPDFRLNTIVNVGGLSDLDKIVDDVGYQYGRLKDDSWTFKIETWGKLYAIYRHMIVSNEWGLIEEMNLLMGETAGRKLGDLAYDLLSDNAPLKDGIPLFHANHNNLITGTALSTSLLGQAVRQAALQKDFSTGRSIGVNLNKILAPMALYDVLEGFFGTTQFVENGGATSRTNIYAGSRFTRIFDARLDDKDPKSFYMLASNRTVRMYFLQGRQDPYIEQREGWTVDGVEYKVRMDAAAVPMSYQTMVKITLP